MYTSEEINELFIKEFDYFIKKFTDVPVNDYGTLCTLFTTKDNCDTITSPELNSTYGFSELVRDICYRVLWEEIPIKNTKQFTQDLYIFLDKFWKQVNYKEYDFKFTTYGNTDMILTIFDKHSNPRATSKAVFQVENQKVIKNFITDIIDSISGEYIEHKVFVIYKGTINSNESINVCLNTQSMKKILKDYTGTIYGLGYKN